MATTATTTTASESRRIVCAAQDLWDEIEMLAEVELPVPGWNACQQQAAAKGRRLITTALDAAAAGDLRKARQFAKVAGKVADRSRPACGR